VLGIYILAAMVGGGLLVFSVLSGAHDGGDVDVHGLDVDAAGFDADLAGVDVDVSGVDVAGADVHVGGLDADHDVDVGHGGAGALVLGFFRPRNLIFFLAAFGITGTVLTVTNASTPDATVLLSLAMGGGALLLTHSLFSWLRRSEVGIDTVGDREMEGHTARVVLPMAPGEPGRVVCTIADREYYLTARVSKDVTKQLVAGSEVVILGIRDGVAEVIPFDMPELPPAES
jgi:membrane protein implicated in regulation of membrane protease activity